MSNSEPHRIPGRAMCVFCGSSFGNNDVYRTAAAELGMLLAQREYTLVYGGGSIGLMGELARSAMRNGGSVVGIIPQNIHERIEDIELTEKRVVVGMHERKAAMYEISDAFVVMPGGLGTLDEFFEIFTWYQLSYHTKPIGLLNINGYFDALLSFLQHASSQGFINSAYLEALIVEPSAEHIIDRLASGNLETIEKLSH